MSETLVDIRNSPEFEVELKKRLIEYDTNPELSLFGNTRSPDNYPRYVASVIRTMYRRNIDWVFVVDGEEGSGKSTFTYSSIVMISHFLGLDYKRVIKENTIYDDDEFLEYVAKLSDYVKVVDGKLVYNKDNINEFLMSNAFVPVVLDEGVNILFNRDSMSKNRKHILKFFNMMRFLRRMTFIASVDVVELDKVFRKRRIKTIIEVGEHGRGTYQLFDGVDSIKQYIAFKNERVKTKPRPTFIGVFGTNTEVEDIVNEIKFRYTMRMSLKAKMEIKMEELKRARKLLEIVKDSKKFGIEVEDLIETYKIAYGDIPPSVQEKIKKLLSQKELNAENDEVEVV